MSDPTPSSKEPREAMEVDSEIAAAVADKERRREPPMDDLGSPLCIIPGCESPLYLEMSGSMGLGLGTPSWPEGVTPETPEFGDMNTTRWQVVCRNGHVIHLPPDDAEDYAEPFKMSKLMEVLRG